MKNFRVQFSRIDNDDDFRQFANDIDGEMEGNDMLHLPRRQAQGLIKKVKLDNGFYMRVWNLMLVYPVELNRLSLPMGEDRQKGFSIIYIFTPKSCMLQRVGDHAQFSKSNDKSILLISDDVTAAFDVMPNQPVQLIDFSITSLQAMQHFNVASGRFEDWYKETLAQQLPLVLLEPSSASVSLSAHRAFDVCLREAKNINLLRELSAQFISEFLQKAIPSNTDKFNGKPAAHFEKIIEAEAIVQSHLQNNLPTLEEIAHRLALSQSTLKRHFKGTFGKSIYEYYLEKKMDLALRLLLEKPLTVNEIAEMMGYEKVSNFIDMFRKHHGYSPGSMKKRRYMDI